MPSQIGSMTKFYLEILKTLDLKAKSELMELLANEISNSSNLKDEVIYSKNNSSKYVCEQIIKEIDLEIDELNDDIREKFLASANQIKELLVNENIKNMPDILMFNKGYVGLMWKTKDDDSIFLYSIPDGSLFYNKVGENFSETNTLAANKENFSNLIKMINVMV